jgi:hypothetical protein
MKSKMRNEFGVPVVVDRSISRPSWTHRGFETKLRHEKATRLWPLRRPIAQHRLSAKRIATEANPLQHAPGSPLASARATASQSESRHTCHSRRCDLR